MISPDERTRALVFFMNADSSVLTFLLMMAAHGTLPTHLRGLGLGWFYNQSGYQLSILEDGTWVVGKETNDGAWSRLVTRRAAIDGSVFLDRNGAVLNDPPPSEISKEIVKVFQGDLLPGIVLKYDAGTPFRIVIL